jgi:hypothetical protein
MSSSRRLAVGLLAAASCWVITLGIASAAGAATPGWECIPATAGQNVVSGGTGAAPSCTAGHTAVLAPTYVASGVGGKPTVQFSAVNLQVVSGSGSTSGTVNGEGNLVVGYAENANGHAQTGSNDLVLGTNNGWSGYGELIGGSNNVASGAFASAFGASNTASGTYALAAGHANVASASWSSATGGEFNTASGQHASVTGGEFNRAGDQFSVITGGCGGLTGPGPALNPACASNGIEAILGGQSNRANGPATVVSGGDFNTANGTQTAISGGENNTVSNFFSSVSGGQSNDAIGQGAAIAGGLSETQGNSQFTQVGASSFAP